MDHGGLSGASTCVYGSYLQRENLRKAFVATEKALGMLAHPNSVPSAMTGQGTCIDRRADIQKASQRGKHQGFVFI